MERYTAEQWSLAVAVARWQKRAARHGGYRAGRNVSKKQATGRAQPVQLNEAARVAVDAAQEWLRSLPTAMLQQLRAAEAEWQSTWETKLAAHEAAGNAQLRTANAQLPNVSVDALSEPSPGACHNKKLLAIELAHAKCADADDRNNAASCPCDNASDGAATKGNAQQCDVVGASACVDDLVSLVSHSLS